MLNEEKVLYWNEVECDLYEENGNIFGVELDLFNNQKYYYHKIIAENEEKYRFLSTNIYTAIKKFNAILEDR